jgi:hypothetical protein
MAGAASFTIYTRTKEFFRDHHLIDHSKLLGSAAVGGIGGAMAGALISFGSAREFCRYPSPATFSYFEDDDQLSNSSRYPGLRGTHYLHCISTLLTIHLLAGSATARIYDRGEERNQVGETPEYRHRCAGHFQNEWIFWVVHWL